MHVHIPGTQSILLYLTHKQSHDQANMESHTMNVINAQIWYIYFKTEVYTVSVLLLSLHRRSNIFKSGGPHIRGSGAAELGRVWEGNPPHTVWKIFHFQEP